MTARETVSLFALLGRVSDEHMLDMHLVLASGKAVSFNLGPSLVVISNETLEVRREGRVFRLMLDAPSCTPAANEPI